MFSCTFVAYLLNLYWCADQACMLLLVCVATNPLHLCSTISLCPSLSPVMMVNPCVLWSRFVYVSAGAGLSKPCSCTSTCQVQLGYSSSGISSSSILLSSITSTAASPPLNPSPPSRILVLLPQPYSNHLNLVVLKQTFLLDAAFTLSISTMSM